ncbi:MAG: Sec-independent protein translocase subunit TatA/TatB [Pseudobdellovibrio sp.]
MSFAHMLILGVIALIVIPPDQLPQVAKQVAKFIYELKRSADQLMGDLKTEAMFKPEDIIDQKLKQQFADLQNTIATPINLDGQNNKPAAPAPTTTQNAPSAYHDDQGHPIQPPPESHQPDAKKNSEEK